MIQIAKKELIFLHFQKFKKEVRPSPFLRIVENPKTVLTIQSLWRDLLIHFLPLWLSLSCDILYINVNDICYEIYAYMHKFHTLDVKFTTSHFSMIREQFLWIDGRLEGGGGGGAEWCSP